MNQPCEKSEVIQYIKESVDKMDAKLDSVIEFKNKALGIIIGITTVVTVVFNLIILIVKK